MVLTVNYHIGWHRFKVEKVKPVLQNIVTEEGINEIEKILKEYIIFIGIGIGI